MSKQLTREAWQRHISAWQHSGQSKRDYCQQHQLGLSTFHQWHAKLALAANPEQTALTLLPVSRPTPISTQPMTAPAVITIQSPHGWRLECPLTIPALTLTTLLSALP